MIPPALDTQMGQIFASSIDKNLPSNNPILMRGGCLNLTFHFSTLLFNQVYFKQLQSPISLSIGSFSGFMDSEVQGSGPCVSGNTLA